MCGICGFTGIRDNELLRSMTEALHHRGPDGAGYFLEGDVGLGHRRLSIIDVAGGAQPMENEDGSLVLVYNGEIYNYQPLRQELLSRGHLFRTRSDSEVILHLYEELGPGCLDRLVGMFALAIYEKRTGRLFLARDRLGIKPLYYITMPGRFLFASEIKALLRYRCFQPTVNPRAIHDYLALRYVPGETGLFEEVHKLPAGHYALVQEGTVNSKPYWQPELYAGPFEGSEEDYLEGFAEKFERSIHRRLISEVPLGAYLSGGVDSSTIVAAMSRLTSKPVRTFSVGFDFKHDESAAAAEVAKGLGCEHTAVACPISDVELLPEIVYHLDEPVGDPIIMPMYVLAREAKKSVSVVLTGEGADEVLGGYLFHKALLTGSKLTRVLPRSLLRGLLRATPASVLNLAFQYPARLGRRGKLKVLDWIDLLEPRRLPLAYRHLISLFDERDTADLYTDDFRARLAKTPDSFDHSDVANSTAPYLNRAIHLQFSHWLPDLILTKQDKLSMAHGIEARVPFLDHELVEFALRLPPSLKIRGGQTKYILRQYAHRILPPEAASRRKMPFYFPMETCFAHRAFQELMHDTLSESSVRARGIVRPETVARLRRSMSRGEFVYVKQVFSLMVLELWFRMAVDGHHISAPPTRRPGGLDHALAGASI